MLTKEDLIIVENKQIAKDTYEMKLTGEVVQFMTEPGQFLHVQVGDGWEHALRRPLSIANVERDNVSVVYKVIGFGTEWLAKQPEGQKINVLAPLGNGFPYKDVKNQHVLLIGGGVGVPPLYYLARKLKDQGNTITTVLGFQSKDAIFYEEKFQELGHCHIATDDGSYGTKGFVTDVVKQNAFSVEKYFSCGPTPMLKAVIQSMSIPGYISLEERMGCGVGACFACVCEANNDIDVKGYRKICQDGPVFSAKEVVLS
ncbi:dihydroorotate dehydrogenase electron transfer subunit [Pontibacillus yanchengensis]|uniref:Dihydroorotate dehydrogenase electron transfer subunit n=2 Tax=Pontibacillus yanchengensis TaxID=462910 RepID=A0ACC7VDR1_9BACI|nr:dihydroorotate dehydrogenase electron transfer subunit [Pontibacillus yanchengensis]MYL33075.1 dihydroorotate dehydrogenase electron transfer subunit [Pontibacillus yanchengensis]MYL52074.1 dihydroorotate dehydrogenase electron transfer subunit [Pontibacillus yanchengensis]